MRGYERSGLYDTEVQRHREILNTKALTRMPAGWVQLKTSRIVDEGLAFDNPVRGLRVIASASRETDGRIWIHMSMSHRDRVPTWNELRDMKSWLIGDDDYAYQVLPPANKYVNRHPYVLHLWAAYGDPPMPDFLRGGDEI